jgi:hypothetical protein
MVSGNARGDALATMVRSGHVRSERVQTSVDRHGNLRKRLVISTNLPAGASTELAELAKETVEFLANHPEFDGADVLHIETLN